MKENCRKHSAAFKAKVAMEAVKGEETIVSWHNGLKYTRP